MIVWALLLIIGAPNALPSATMFPTEEDCAAALTRVVQANETRGETVLDAMCVRSVVPPRLLVRR